MELRELANIRTGVVLSRKEAELGTSKITYNALNLKAVSENGTLDCKAIEPYYATERLNPECFSHKRDVLLRLSAPYTAILIDESHTDLLIPAHFAIIRTKPKLLDSYFLHWWLTNNRRHFYKAASGGTMMGTISSGYIANMKIEPVPIVIQKQLGELLRLSKKERQLLLQLANKKKCLTDGVINQILNGGTI